MVMAIATFVAKHQNGKIPDRTFLDPTPDWLLAWADLGFYNIVYLFKPSDPLTNQS